MDSGVGNRGRRAEEPSGSTRAPTGDAQVQGGLTLKRSAGLLLYRVRPGSVEVLLGHPGGPFFRKKDHGAWTIPKGLLEDEHEG